MIGPAPPPRAPQLWRLTVSGAGRPVVRNCLRRLPAADLHELLRNQRARHLPTLPWPDRGRVESRLAREAVREGARARCRGRPARGRALLRHRGHDRVRARPGRGRGRPHGGRGGAQGLERPRGMALPGTGHVSDVLRGGGDRFLHDRARGGETDAKPGARRLGRYRRRFERLAGGPPGERQRAAAGAARSAHPDPGHRGAHGVRVRRADRDRHRQPDSPAHRRICAVRGVEVEQRRRTAGYGPLSGRRPKRARVRLRVIDQPSRQAASVCPQCGTHIAPALLACPSCQRLVHADELKRLAADAEQAVKAGDRSAALAAWREALDLLPTDSTQHQVVAARVEELSRALDRAPTPAATRPGSRWGKGAAGLGALGALLAKFKFALVFVLTKAKLLLLGLTKASTLFTMLLSAGVYWAAWGWKFALGVVLSIYVHEMGHVQALQRYGIKATAPMFIPGVGAVVRLKQYPASPREDARVGLAGPLWGLGAAAVASFAGRAAETPDAPALLEYTWLVAALSLMTLIHVPTGAVG